jgi:uncharacterized protein (DUF1697 family)
MPTYFLFLRAINVGGRNIIKMADLKSWMQQLGFRDVKTYLQSGNVVFTASETGEAILTKQIHEMVFERSKLKIACIVRSSESLENISNMMMKHEASKLADANIFLTMLAQKPSAENIEKLTNVTFQDDKFTFYNDYIVLECRQPYHKTKLSNNFFEKLLKVDATTRNLNTVQAMLELISSGK